MKLLQCYIDNIITNALMEDINYIDAAADNLIPPEHESSAYYVAKDSGVVCGIEIAKRVEPLEQVVDKLISTTKANHISRLQKGACTIELGFVLSDLLNNYERISDHCSNIAVAIIETSHNSFGTHEYLNAVKNANDEQFENDYSEFASKYVIVQK